MRLCPVTAGPYLRLAWLSQPSAPDVIMSNGRAPTASLTVAALPPRPDEEGYPKGFYLASHPGDIRGSAVTAATSPMTGTLTTASSSRILTRRVLQS